ncbi:MAG: hypothetical protein K2F74_03630, partial [Muribaculaceae bacterium]|nr:hypothetical protein [Muribaculaceae bacterium]
WCLFQNKVPTVCLKRMSRDGKTIWEGAATGTGSDYAQYPYLVNSGDNTCILVYAATASQVLYARKLDFEGESVWGKDVRIYRGGWGSIPMHTLVNVRPSGNGGVLVAWSDDRANTQVESAYISYVTPDGKLGFAGVSDEGDCKLCYDGWRCFNVDVVPAGDGSAFYAVWRRTDNPQRMQGVKMQKVSLEGELLWGDDAKELCPTDFYSTGYISLQPDDDNGACCFYEIYREYYDQQCFAARFDSEGELVWPDASVALSAPARKASSLQSQPYGENAWLCNWDDGGTLEDKSTTYVMALLYDDGCLGKPGTGLADVTAESGALSYRAGTLYADVADGCKAVVYTPTGVKAAEGVFKGGSAAVRLRPGLYMAAAEGCATIKFVVEQ